MRNQTKSRTTYNSHPTCQLCELHLQCRSPGLGRDAERAEVLVIGEAPGAAEDAERAPFVGPSGKLLRRLVAQEGIQSAAYTNVVRCRPPANRTPSAVEAKACRPYLDDDVAEAGPTVIVAVGATALKSLLGPHVKLSEALGQTYEYQGVPLVASYHPAFVLRSPRALPALKASLAQASRVVRGEVHTPPSVGDVSGDVLSIDVECDPQGALLCLAVADRADRGSWQPVLHSVGTGRLDIPDSWRSSRLIGQNFAFDLGVIQDHTGEDLSAQWSDDTMLMSHLLDENLPKGLKFQSNYRLGVPNYAEDTRQFSVLYDPDRLRDYNLQDACATYGLWEQFAKMIHDEGLQVIYDRIVMPTARMTYRMTRRGIGLDIERTQEFLADIEARQRRLGDELDPEVNWHPSSNSFRKFMGQHFYPVRWTEKGLPSWDAAALYTLAQGEKADLALDILRWRELEGQRKFLNSWLSLVGEDGRLHPVYNVAGTETGRLSSQKPNIQQVPRGELRSCFVPQDGYTFVDCDFSQLEVRLTALRAREPTMTEAYRNGDDLHQLLADRVGVDRQTGKTLNLALMYGMSPGMFVETQIKRGVKVARSQAEKWYALYHDTYSRLKPWYVEEVEAALVNGYAQDPLGRKRRLPDLTSTDQKLAEHARKQAVNFPIQSLGNALCLLAAQRIDDELGEGGLVALVHDEILAEVPEDKADETKELMTEIMENPDLTGFPRLHGTEFGSVPLVAEGGTGPTWQHCK